MEWKCFPHSSPTFFSASRSSLFVWCKRNKEKKFSLLSRRNGKRVCWVCVLLPTHDGTKAERIVWSKTKCYLFRHNTHPHNIRQGTSRQKSSSTHPEGSALVSRWKATRDILLFMYYCSLCTVLLLLVFIYILFFSTFCHKVNSELSYEHLPDSTITRERKQQASLKLSFGSFWSPFERVKIDLFTLLFDCCYDDEWMLKNQKVVKMFDKAFEGKGSKLEAPKDLT